MVGGKSTSQNRREVDYVPLNMTVTLFSGSKFVCNAMFVKNLLLEDKSFFDEGVQSQFSPFQ